MEKNLTLRLNETVLRRAKHIAVEHDVSLSRWVAELIRKAIQDEGHFEKAKVRALKRLDRGLDLGGQPLARADIYDR